MAGVEPYAPCPCGSGQKFKWCCHKVESFADRRSGSSTAGRSRRPSRCSTRGLQGAGQPLAADPQGDHADPPRERRARQSDAPPGPPEEPEALRRPGPADPLRAGDRGAGQRRGMFQQVLSSSPTSPAAALAGPGPGGRPPAGRVSAAIPAALKHLELALAQRRRSRPDAASASSSRPPQHLPLAQGPLSLAPAPDDLGGGRPGPVREALGAGPLAASGPRPPPVRRPVGPRARGGEADYQPGPLPALARRRAPAPSARSATASPELGRSTEAVDLEALCQLIEPDPRRRPGRDVQLIWPLRNREAPPRHPPRPARHRRRGPARIDPEDPSRPRSPTIRPARPPRHRPPRTGKGLTPDQIPRILGRVSVGQEIVALETYDDGRVDSLGDRFTALAGPRDRPGAPQDQGARRGLAVEPGPGLGMALPRGDPSRAEADRLDRSSGPRSSAIVWPVTPMPYLGFRTPRQAAGDGDSLRPAPRAVLCSSSRTRRSTEPALDFAARSATA